MGVIFKEADVVGGTFARVMLCDLQKSGISMDEIWRRYYLYSEGKLRREDFWQGFKGDINQLERKYLDALELNNEYDLIRRLGGPFKLGIVSNLPAEWGDYLIAKYRFRETFDSIVVSGSVERRKPDPEIYRIALRGLGHVHDVYVIDDKVSNLRVVEEVFGWKTVWMTTRPPDCDFKPMFRIGRLSELASILSLGSGNISGISEARPAADRSRRATLKQKRVRASLNPSPSVEKNNPNARKQR
jgi:FMN phosphatase YigB (HAD superfamily)